MAFSPVTIPSNMSSQEYADFCALSQLIQTPLEVHPPIRAKSFLSNNEIKFLACLIKWLPNYVVFTQVHLLQMIEVNENDIDNSFMKNYEYIVGDDTPEKRKSAYWMVFNMVNLLSVDFVISDFLGVPKYAIELDGPEHQKDARLIERDKIKNHVLSVINIPLLRIDNSELNSLNLLESKVKGFVK